MRTNLRLLAAVFLISLAGVALLRADDLRGVLTDYNVTAWGDRDGLPRGAIRALAQDGAGYLWIGTEYALVRFDGVRFLTWESLGHTPLPRAAVQTLRVSRDGSLWVGLDHPSGLARLQGDTVQTFRPADGLPAGPVQSIVEDSTGVIWAATTNGLFAFANGRWEREPSVPAGRVRKLHAGRSGAVFAVLDQSVVARRPGASRFEHINTPERYVSGLHEDRSGHVWMADTFVGVMTDYSTGVLRLEVQGGSGVGTSVLPDRAAGLWIATAGQGLWYARSPKPDAPLVVETVTSLTGLSNDVVNAVLQDRDGNIWAGTADGLNRLRRHPFPTIPGLNGAVGLDRGPDGTVWAATPTRLVRFSSGTIAKSDSVPLPQPIRALHVAADGAWVAADDGVWRYVKTPTGLTRSRITDVLKRVREITSDDTGAVWFYDLERGVARWLGTRLEFLPLPAKYRNALVCAMNTDSQGRVWIGLRQEGALAIEPDRTVTEYGAAQGLSLGSCTDVYEDANKTLWVLGVHGVSRFGNGRFTTLSGPGDVPLENVHGMVRDSSGDMWLNSQSSISRIHEGDLEHAFAGRWDRVRADVFNAASGIAGMSARVGHSVVRTRPENCGS